MIKITSHISIHENEIQEDFIRASGPGGQNVNKVASAVQLRFDVRHSPALPEDVRERLFRLAGKRMTKEGFLIINARKFRTQEQNREDALNRLIELIRQAILPPPAPRRKRKASLGSKLRRLENKRRKSKLKRLRKPVSKIDHL